MQDYGELDAGGRADFRTNFDKTPMKNGVKDLSWVGTLMEQRQKISSVMVGKTEDFLYRWNWEQQFSNVLCLCWFGVFMWEQQFSLCFDECVFCL